MNRYVEISAHLLAPLKLEISRQAVSLNFIAVHESSDRQEIQDTLQLHYFTRCFAVIRHLSFVIRDDVSRVQSGYGLHLLKGCIHRQHDEDRHTDKYEQLIVQN